MPSANEYSLLYAFMQSNTEETTPATTTGTIMLMVVVVSSNPYLYNMNAIQVSLCATLFPHIYAFTFGAQNTFNLTNNDSQWQFSEASRPAPHTQHTQSTSILAYAWNDLRCRHFVHGIDSEAQQMKRRKNSAFFHCVGSLAMVTETNRSAQKRDEEDEKPNLNSKLWTFICRRCAQNEV